MRALCWLRADLRSRDNPALHEACERATRGVVAVFTICAEQWRHEHHMADVRAGFLLRSLHELSRELEKRNVALRILDVPRFADVPNALLDLAVQADCDTLFFNREYEINELRRDEQVESVFRTADRTVCSRHDQTIVEPGELQTGTGGDYTVYTPFKNRWLAYVRDAGLGTPLGLPKRQKAMVGKSDELPDSIDGFDLEADLPELWPAGEREAKRRLTAFLDDPVARYQTRRDLPAEDGTSTLSPYLAIGAISALTCVNEAVAHNGDKLSGGRRGPDTWIEELIWRDFYRNVMFCFPRVCMGRPFKLDTDAVPWRTDKEQFAAWCEGRTGIPIVDAGMRQMLATGWMHNRIRMVTAMFLTKQLLVDWRWGEKWFMRHLIDGDLASNNGGWQWSASTGTDAAPYFRIFNPYSQSQKFDKAGAYIRLWVPELRDLDDKAIHDPGVLPPLERSALRYPKPVVDHSEGRARALEAFKSAKA